MSAEKVSALGKEVGHELRTRREKAGYNGLELSKRLGWSTTKVSRAESGVYPLSPTDVMVYLASCGIPRTEANRVVDLAKEGETNYRLKQHSDDIQDETRTLILHEQSALTIDMYDPIYVPTLLQIEHYVRARLIEANVDSTPILEHRMQCVESRQAVSRNSRQQTCTFFVHENALLTTIGDNLIMSEQLLHLVFMSSWRRCVIRVVPRAAHGIGLAKNGFERMTFANQDPMIVIDQETHSLLLDNKRDTKHYGSVLNRLDRVALDEEQSRTVLAQIADRYDGPPNSGDELGRAGDAS